MSCSALRLLGGAAGLWLGVTAHAGPDRIFWSDDRVWEGAVSLSGAGDLRLHDGTRLRNWPLGEIASLDWHPVTQRLERAWRFVEAGQTAKEYSGGVYPTIELGSVVTLRDGRSVPGHLLTTVLYLEQDGTTRKVVVKTKLRGQEGQGPHDIVYPTRVVLGGAAATRRQRCRVRLDAAAGWREPELAMVARRPATAAAAVERLDRVSFACDVEGTEPVWAVRDGARIVVGWNDAAGSGDRIRAAAAAGDARDFFDERILLGVATNSLPETVLTLMLLSRAGATTLEGAKTQPWRLEVWRWRFAPDGRNQLAARAVLFRGLRGRDEPLPVIELEPSWEATELPAELTLSRPAPRVPASGGALP
ncbi:MAG: hypothetical protein PHR35_03205 [Kiritimatiellae bacterium]|nr:hypothetical protein [Kiritimatiellia bacterium]